MSTPRRARVHPSPAAPGSPQAWGPALRGSTHPGTGTGPGTDNSSDNANDNANDNHRGTLGMNMKAGTAHTAPGGAEDGGTAVHSVLSSSLDTTNLTSPQPVARSTLPPAGGGGTVGGMVESKGGEHGGLADREPLLDTGAALDGGSGIRRVTSNRDRSDTTESAFGKHSVPRKTKDEVRALVRSVLDAEQRHGDMQVKPLRPPAPFGFINPDAPAKAVWDWVLVVFVMYGAVVIPLNVALLDDSPLGSFEYLVDALFLLDVLINFRTGVEVEWGGVSYLQREIFWRFAPPPPPCVVGMSGAVRALTVWHGGYAFVQICQRLVCY